MVREPVPDWAIERAVELWVRNIRRPRFDNGDNSFGGAVTAGLAANNAEASSPNDLENRLTIFREHLVKRLKFDRDHDGELNGEILYKGHPGEQPGRHYFSPFLTVDYHPDKNLADAADIAGISHNLFSWKSRVYIGEKFVSTSLGYGAEDDYHYPLPDGRWLICKLHGADMDKIIASLAAIDGLTIEDAAGSGNG